MTQPYYNIIRKYLTYSHKTGQLLRIDNGQPTYLEPKNKGKYRVKCGSYKFDNMRAAWFLLRGDYLDRDRIYPKDGDRKNTLASNMICLAESERKCSLCHTIKPISEFSPRPNNRRRVASQCRSCKREKYAEPNRARTLAQNFNISVQAYEELLAAQGGVCAICKKPPPEHRRLAVDHCHSSEVVRGLLCLSCNAALGAFGDDPKNLERAIKYLTTV